MTESIETFFALDYKLGNARSPAIHMDDVVITFIGYDNNVQHVKLSKEKASALAIELSKGVKP